MSSRGEQGRLVGARLRRLREEAGLSLAGLATRVPYSRAALGHYETGTRAAPSEVIDWYERVHAQAVPALPRARRDPRAADAALAAAIAHRTGRPLIEIGRPHQGDSGYFCPFRIDGLIEGEAAGTDATTALRSALRAIGDELGRAGKR
ncbi:helix-turn-helix domain-containing protein [Nocardia ignorata]|uniref:Helix-turn-helix protein n=1 Tax=Nocardia ignorata TaxID=145285 RepID=A0A4R6P3Z3_NOCIG|nr:helix-turn-helix transcriptional regulator [Nocardia ignorata]TDP32291.1 helix-turn-helix protein [Nocardia ignorata]